MTRVNPTTFVAELDKGWATDLKHEVNLSDVEGLGVDSASLEWAEETFSMLRKPRPLVERWCLQWRPSLETPTIDPVAEKAQDSDADPTAVQKAIESHVKSPYLGKKTAPDGSTVDNPVAASPLLKSLATTGTNKQPAVDFAPVAFLDCYADDRSWLVELLATGGGELTPEREKVMSCKEIIRHLLGMQKRISELEKGFEKQAQGVKSSAWETVSTMMDYMSSQEWWNHGPGKDFTQVMTAITKSIKLADFGEVRTWPFHSVPSPE